MIDIAKLTKKDVGRWVEYRPSYGDPERGKIKSWNDSGIFVVYNTGGNWDDFMDYTGAHTNKSDLHFVTVMGEPEEA